MTPNYDSSEWRKNLLTIVERALAVPENERSALIRQSCRDDARLLQEAESLLSMETDAIGFLPDGDPRLERSTQIVQGHAVTSGKFSAEDQRFRNTRIDKYLMLEPLGHGGMGVVWRAEDTVLQRQVAIKLLPEHLAHDETATRRFLREARAAANLNHPNAVTLYDYGQHDDRVYLVMELVEGPSAGKLVETSGPMSWQTATRVMIQICAAVEQAHTGGLIHRDIKPSNVLLSVSNSSTVPQPSTGQSLPLEHATAKLADFGISKSMMEATETISRDVAIGTPQFMSPEQIRGEPVDARSDVYSLGATYFALLTGQPPFVRADAMQVMFAHCDAPIPDPSVHNPSIPGQCSAVIQRAMAKRPDDRFLDVRSFRGDLEQLLRASDLTSSSLPETVVTKRPRRAQFRVPQYYIGFGCLAIILVAVVAGYQPWSHPNAPDELPVPSTRDVEPHRIQGSASKKSQASWSVDLGNKLGAVTMSPSGSRIAWSVSEGESQQGRVIVRNFGDTENRYSQRLAEPYSAPTSIAFLNDDTIVYAVKSRVSLIRLTPPANALDLFQCKDGTCQTIAYNAPAKQLAVATHVWSDKRSRLEILTLEGVRTEPKVANKTSVRLGPQDNLVLIAYSRNGENLAATTSSGEVLLIDADQGVVRETYRVQHDPSLATELGHALAFSPDGRWLASGGSHAVHLWNLQTGVSRKLDDAHRFSILTVAFNEAGTRIASGSTDGIRLWDVASGKQQTETAYLGHGGNYVTFLRFLNGGRTLLSAGFDNRFQTIQIP